MNYLSYLIGGLLCCLCLLTNCTEGNLPQLPQLSIESVEVSVLDSLYMSATIKGIGIDDRKKLKEDDFGFIILNEMNERISEPKANWKMDSLTFFASQDSLGLGQSIKVVAFIRGVHDFYDRQIIYSDTTLFFDTHIPIFTHEFDIDNTPAVTIQTGILNDLRLSETAEVGHIWILKENNITPELTHETADSIYSRTPAKRFYENTINLNVLGVTSAKRYLFVIGYVKYRDNPIPFYGDIVSIKLGNFWEAIAPPENDFECRYGAISFTAQGYGYVGLGSKTTNCGKNFDAGSFLRDLWRFDPQNQIWEEMEPLPIREGSGLVESVAFVVNNRIFVGLGTSGSTYQRKFYEYFPDMEKGRWEKFSSEENYPEGRRGAAAFVIGNTAYIGLGQNRTTSDLILKEDFYTFSPKDGEKNVWTKLENSLIGKNGGVLARMNTATFSLVGKGYVCSGYTDKNANNSFDDLWIYDPTQETGNRWCKGANLPGRPREQAISLADGKYGYVIGGGKLTDSKNNIPCANESDVWQYNPDKDEWKALAVLPDRRAAGIGFVLDSIIYVGFGHVSNAVSNSTCDNRFYKYIPEN